MMFAVWCFLYVFFFFPGMCSLFVCLFVCVFVDVCCLAFVVVCSLCVVCCRLCAVCCSLLDVCCVLFFWRLLVVVRCLLCVVS